MIGVGFLHLDEGEWMRLTIKKGRFAKTLHFRLIFHTFP